MRARTNDSDSNGNTAYLMTADVSVNITPAVNALAGSVWTRPKTEGLTTYHGYRGCEEGCCVSFKWLESQVRT